MDAPGLADAWQTGGAPMDAEAQAPQFRIQAGRFFMLPKYENTTRPKLVKSLGCTMQLTGQRPGRRRLAWTPGNQKDSATAYSKADRLFIVSPLTGWTDSTITRYLAQNAIPEHPARPRAPGLSAVCFAAAARNSLIPAFPYSAGNAPIYGAGSWWRPAPARLS